MTPVVVQLAVFLAYASWAIELTALHVPSVASTAKIWSRSPEVELAYSPSYRRVLSLSRPKKLLLFGLPLLVVYAIYLYPLIALWGPRDPLGDHAFAPTAATDLLAAVLILVGRAITLGSVITIRGEVSAAPAPLRTRALFRYSRNPGLVGMYVFVAGLWVAAPSITMLCGVLVYIGYMDFKVRMEEDYLTNAFGASYRAYREQTPRYLA